MRPVWMPRYKWPRAALHSDRDSRWLSRDCSRPRDYAASLARNPRASTLTRCPWWMCDSPQHGYWLSSYTSEDNVDTYYQADARVQITVDGTGDNAPVSATLNLSNPICTGGCPSGKPLQLAPCVVKYNIVCLTDSDSTVWGWAVDETNKPACTQAPSDWTCKARLTGTKYQDIGHQASFFTRLAWEPDVPGPPLHLMPFGVSSSASAARRSSAVLTRPSLRCAYPFQTFMTGCPAENNGQIQGRLIKDM